MKGFAAQAHVVRTAQTQVRIAIVILAIVTGVALATPVPVLSMATERDIVVAPLDDLDALTYSYRQSIYDVPVYEEFERRGDALELLRVRSPDIRSVEYFRWDGDIVKGADGLWTEDAPPSEHTELVLRVAPLGQQRISTARWSYDLLPVFGEAVVTVRVERLAPAAEWWRRLGVWRR
ncbi:MAG: hypothetical protein M3R54_00180 [Chloroflexota bacterium]|nr:hypothetical protein [Chloroflexota bacterium]